MIVRSINPRKHNGEGVQIDSPLDFFKIFYRTFNFSHALSNSCSLLLNTFFDVYMKFLPTLVLEKIIFKFYANFNFFSKKYSFRLNVIFNFSYLKRHPFLQFLRSS